MRSAPYHLALLAASLLAVPAAARAQAVDADALAQLFGQPVTESATGQPQLASSAPADMVIITQSQIARSGARTIPELLRFVAGMDVREYGTGDSSVGIRGNTTAINPRVLVLLDGRQVSRDDYGNVVWQLIPVALQNIRQIEIIKGPNAALYGFNAVSGVINIIPFEMLSDTVNSVRVDGGTQSAAGGEAVGTARLNRSIAFQLTATGSRSDEFSSGPTVPVFGQSHAGTLSAALDMRLAPRVDLDLSASIGDVFTSTYIDLGLYSPVDFRANSVRGRLRADTREGLLSLDLYRNENRTLLSTPVLPGGYRNDVTVLRVGDTLLPGPSHVVRLGLELRDNSISSQAFFDGRLGYTIIAGSVMWNWLITPTLSLTNAMRVDWLELYHDGAQFYSVDAPDGLFHDTGIVAPSFNSGLVYTLDSRDVVRLLAARAIQLPSLFDLGISRLGGPVLVEGQPTLQPSDVLNAELDWDRTIQALSGQFRAAAFIQYMDRTVGSPFGSGITVLPTGVVSLQAVDFAGSREIGGEIELRGGEGRPVHWSLGYALALVHDETTGILLAQASSIAYENQTPTHAVVAGIGTSRGRFDLDLQARWQSSFRDYSLSLTTFQTTMQTILNYVTVDAKLGYRLGYGTTIGVVVQQLDRAALVETAGLRVQRSIFATLSIRM